MNTTQYDYDYFITKFSAIPASLWTTGLVGHGLFHCALGHCGATTSLYKGLPDEAKALADLLSVFPPHPIHVGHGGSASVISINDGGPTDFGCPRARILAALHDAKARAEAALDEYERRELKPISPVLQEQVSATDATQLGLCASVVLEEERVTI